MCTAIRLKTKDLYFGRNLDYDCSYGQQITLTPRNFPLTFRDAGALNTHYAILGMARVDNHYPLYFDAVNEKGLAMAGLNFVGNAQYFPKEDSKDNITHFELIPWLLAQCESVKAAKKLLKSLNITDIPFSKELPPAQLHWIIADREEAVTVESVEEGLFVYENPVGVLTNNPPFPQQLFQLNHFMHLSPKAPQNRFCPNLSLSPYSRGMGALGLPGDLSSGSRFVRAAFVKLNSVCTENEADSVSQFFHILGAVEQVKGNCETENGEYEKTIYTSCCNADKGIYYYTTYENRQICAVTMHNEDLDGEQLLLYPLITRENIHFQN